MDALTELFTYFDNHITDLPFYYPKKTFFQELKDSTTNPYLTHQSQNWLSLRLKEYCQERQYQLNPHGRERRWDNAQKKEITYLYITK